MPGHNHRQRVHPRRVRRGTEAGQHRPRDAHKPEPADPGRADVGAGLDRGAPAGEHHGGAGPQGQDHRDLNPPAVEPGIPDLRLGAAFIGRKVFVLWQRK